MDVTIGIREIGPDKNFLVLKLFKKNYRSLNFSTTRTLSPRTVIGIGTTLS